MFFLNSVLYVVGIPIGNIFDFSNRSILILKNVDFILAEDSRKFCFLMSFFYFKNKVIVLNSLNEKVISDKLINLIKSGFSAAIVSDSGTPCISDPGGFLIRKIYYNNIKIIVVPGPSVVSAALSICPFDVSKFIFEGFLPKKKIYKEIFFKKLILENRVCVFFESGSRLLESIFLLKKIINDDRNLFIAKDLTKKFEIVFSFKINEINIDFFEKTNISFNGEFILLLNSYECKMFKHGVFSVSNFLKTDVFLVSIVFSSYNSFFNLTFLFF